MAFLGALGSAIGSVAGGASGYESGVQNSKIEYANALQERQLTMEQETQADREQFLRIGEMRAAGGASGSTSGSFGDVMADAAAQLTLQKQSIVYAGSVNAERLATGAAVSMAKGQNALTSGVGQAAADLGKYYAGKSNGAGTNLVNAGSGAQDNSVGGT